MSKILCTFARNFACGTKIYDGYAALQMRKAVSYT